MTLFRPTTTDRDRPGLPLHEDDTVIVGARAECERHYLGSQSGRGAEAGPPAGDVRDATYPAVVTDRPSLPPRDDLMASILRFVQDAKHRQQVTVPVENRDDFVVLGPLVHRVRRYARAFLRISRAGHEVEGRVLVRSALEHAVTAQWAYLTPGGTARLTRSQAIAQAEVAELMTTYSANPEWPKFASQFRESVPPGKALPKFSGAQGIMAELDSVKFLAVTYKLMSSTGHVSHETALDYFIDVDGDLHIQDDPESTFTDETLYALAGFCLLASWLLARLEGDAAEIRVAQEAGARLHLPWRLDTHLPPARRRFPLDDN